MVAKSNALTVEVTGDREVVMKREFNAPRALVFEAFTKPEHVAQWFGRTGSTLSTCEIDLRVGGAWRFVERSAGGDEHPFKGEYKEVAAPERLAYTFIYDVPPFNEKSVLTTIVFTEPAPGRTLMTETMTFDSTEDRDGMLQSGMEEGANESMDRMDELLARLQK